MDIQTLRLLLLECYIVVPEHIEWLNDKKLMRWSEQQFKEHDDESQDYFLMCARSHGTPLVWDIRLKPEASGTTLGHLEWPTIGSIHAHIDRRHKRADLGILLGPEFHGKGYAIEAWQAVSDYLFAKEEMEKLEAGCASGNLPMRKLLMKLGWEEEGFRRQHFIYDGHKCGLILFGKVRS